jgi:hypothetical protein
MRPLAAAGEAQAILVEWQDADTSVCWIGRERCVVSFVLVATFSGLATPPAQGGDSCWDVKCCIVATWCLVEEHVR